MTAIEGKKVNAGDRIVLNDRARVWTRGKVFTVEHADGWGVRCFMMAANEPARLPDDDGRAWYAALWDEIAEVVK